MKRLVYDPKTTGFKWINWKPDYVSDFGNTCVIKDRNIDNKYRINNQEVSGSSRTALYTMPGGVDTGVRYAALYEHSGLDITETMAIKSAIEATKNKVESMIAEEVDKQVKENLPKAHDKDNNIAGSNSNSSDSNNN